MRLPAPRLRKRKLRPGPDILRRRTTQHLELASFCNPRLRLVVVVSQSLAVDSQRHRLALARLEIHLREGFEFFFMTLQARCAISYIELDHLFACIATRVGDIDRDVQRVIRTDFLSTQRKRAVAERCVGKTEAEREQRRNFLLLVVAIADKQSLAVVDPPVLARVVKIGRIILQTSGEGLREFARRIGIAEEHVRDGIATFLPGVPDLDYGRYLIEPVHGDRRSRVEDYHSILVRCCHFLDQGNLPTHQFHIRPVEAFALPFSAQSDKYERYIRTRGQLCRALYGVCRDWREAAKANGGYRGRLVLAIFNGDGIGAPGHQVNRSGSFTAAETIVRLARSLP